MFALSLSFVATAQKVFSPNLNGFAKETLQSAMDGSVDFMTAEEQKVVFFMNLVRLEPQVFLTDVLQPYVKFHELNENTYLKSLYRDLSKAPSTAVFVMKKDLFEVSKLHVQDIGKKGLTGHKGSQGKTFKRRVNHLFSTYLTVSENVGLGFKSPLDNVIGLLIDDGVKDLGHRKAILSPDYNCVGVALGAHKNYTYGCVMDFGQLAKG